MTGPSSSSPSSSLHAARRSAELAELADGAVVDVLVVGGGITGAGVALDAATRGLSVALVEAHDLAWGTSRWSSKLVHGGLRYLAHGDVGLAWESAVERGRLMRFVAPHLVRPLPMVIPVGTGTTRSDELTLAAGVAAGDVLRVAAGTRTRVLPRPRRLTAAEALHLAPALRAAGLRGGLLMWDGQLVDDARLVTAVARTAASYGARILTRARAERLDGTGAVVTDVLTGASLRVRARSVVNATGVWAGTLAPAVRLVPSRGTHLVLPARLFGGLRAALSLPMPGERGRFALVLPQDDGRVYVGLTDEPADSVDEVPRPTEAEIDRLLEVVSTALEVPLSRTDVLGAFAGLRPLLPGPAGRTCDLSRHHAVLTGDDGVVTVVGGKLTTYRRMAQDAVDAVVAARALRAGPCRTARLPLVGAARSDQLAAVRAPRRLVRRYGTEAPDVLALADHDPSLLRPLVDGVDVTAAELLFALHHEGALTADDLVDRRTRLGLVPADRERVLPVVAALAGAAGLGGPTAARHQP